MAMRSAFFPLVTLIVLAPLFGEYLLGNQKLSEIARLPLLACLYGPGALVVRETARRLGRGTGTMMALAAAYALIEEGVVVQMLFNPALVPQGITALPSVIPGLGADLWITMIVVSHHVIFSITLPIVLTEALFPAGHNRPWLGRRGYAAALVAFGLGAGGVMALIWSATGYFAAPHQWGSALGLAALITGAALIWPPRKPQGAAAPHGLPRPVIFGLAAFALTSLYMLTIALPGWWRPVACLVLAPGGLGLLAALSRRPGWTLRHRLWTAGGCLLTSAWLGSAAVPFSGPRGSADAAALIALVVVTWLLWALSLWRSRAVLDNAPPLPLAQRR